MHTVWKGAVSFGLVHIPVKMHAATEDRDVHFRQLHRDCGMPIKYEKTCPHCQKGVTSEDIVRGFEYEKDKYVIIKDEEMNAIKPESASSIKILDFVDLKDIDPIYYEKTYYLSPDLSGGGAYNLLVRAIGDSGKIGIAKISIRGKSNLAAIRCIANCLVLETMRYPDEIRAVDQVPNLAAPGAVNIDDSELQIAMMLVDKLSGPFDAAKYTDEYRSSLLQLIDDKIAGENPDIVTAVTPAGPSKVIDLMAALQASLQAVQTPTDSGGKKPRKKAAAKSKEAKTS